MAACLHPLDTARAKCNYWLPARVRACMQEKEKEKEKHGGRDRDIMNSMSVCESKLAVWLSMWKKH